MRLSVTENYTMSTRLHVRLTAAALALATAFAQAQQAFPPVSPSASADSGGDKLPDLSAAGQKGGPNYNFSANGGGVNLDRRDADSRLSTHVESSQLTGSAIGITGGMALGESAALGGGISYGANKQEFFANLGWNIDPAQRLILTGSQLRQNIDFDFPSGRARADLVQNSGGLSYRMALTGGALDHLEFNAYSATTASKDLGAVNYAVDTAALYELWLDPRRIAGGRIAGFQGNTGLVPWQGGRLDFGLGQERLRYDFLGGAENHTRGTARFEIGQALTADTRLKFGADGGAAQTRYSLGFDVAVDGGKLGLAFDSVRGRDGALNDNRVQLSWTLLLGNSGKAAAAPLNLGASKFAAGGTAASVASVGPLVDQVAVRPSWIPSQVIAMLDKTAAPTRLIAVDKTALPAGSSIDTATGAITTPLGVAVTAIAGVTKNGGAFANAGQFALSGNSLIISPRLIAQPAVGVVDTYVVTANNLGGGTTLVTINVSHGSVKIDSIVISAGDTTAPTTSGGPSVSGTHGTGTTLSVTINEAGTGYYLVQPAAAAAPTVTAVLAGTSFAMAANIAATSAITGLTASTAYKIYFVAKDTAGNAQAAVQNVAVTTTAGTAPTASNVTITGTVQVGQQLTGSYTYADVEGNAQGVSTFRWLRNGVAIGGATASTYTLVNADYGNTITFEVTPVATVVPTNGPPVVSSATAAVTLPAGYVSQGGLIWMPVAATWYKWAQANTLCAGSILGQTGWRLPTQAELAALQTSGAMNGQGWTLNATWSSEAGGAGNLFTYLNAAAFWGSGDASINSLATCVK
jgi:hypothetical protein